MRLRPLCAKAISSIKHDDLRPAFPLYWRLSAASPWSSRIAISTSQCFPRQFSYTAILRNEDTEAAKPPKRKPRKKRGPTAKASLGRIAMEAELNQRKDESVELQPEKTDHQRLVTAYCFAQEYDMNQVHSILRKRGMQIGPSGTLLYPEEPEVIHIEMPLNKDVIPLFTSSGSSESGDVFIFPSGTIVSWGVPRSHIDFLSSEVIQPAARKPLGDDAEDENLEFSEDPNEDGSYIRAENIVLGTKLPSSQNNLESGQTSRDAHHRPTRIVLAKIAFSSGLARATKLAVLENLINEYSQSSRAILSILMNGSMRLKSRKWVYEKIGQLLDLRAQLNLYSELADDLPDLFWDTKQELGLENYYDQVGRVLDTEIRIKTLNQKMDYAEEIIGNLRDMRSEIHSARLEWIIIGLITFEVLYALWTEAVRIPAREAAKNDVEAKAV